MIIKTILQLMLSNRDITQLKINYPQSTLLIQRQSDGRLTVTNGRSDSAADENLSGIDITANNSTLQVLAQST